MDFFALPNEESERGVYYSLIGVGGSDLERIREIGRKWLSMGPEQVSTPGGRGSAPRIPLNESEQCESYKARRTPAER